MEHYAEQLAESIAGSSGGAFEIHRCQPTLPSWPKSGVVGRALRLRWARYVSYPREAERNQGAINHVVDHTYAHLLKAVEPSRTVITVHDLMPLLAWKGEIPGLSYPHYPFFFKYSIACLRRAGVVIAVSERTKQDLIAHCGLPEHQVTVVHNGIDRRFHPLAPAERAAARASFGLPDARTHVVLITGNQLYKNHRISFQVIARLRDAVTKPIQLVWLGGNPSDMQPGTEGRVDLGNRPICIRDLSSERLVDLYNSVDCLLFPSLYEGFGWPPLEAMACGTPVVTSRAPSLMEIVVDAALSAAADDVNGLTEAVRTLLEDPEVRRSHIEKGYRNATRFKWEKWAGGVVSVYERLLAGRA